MKKFLPSLRAFTGLFLILFILLGSCKKSNSPGSGQNNNRPPAITTIGTPVGSPTTKNIGAGGGSLVSPDGRLQLDIPSGALAGNTDISIQPVTNESPGGVGLAYQLLPEGIAFNKPVTLTYHYTKAEINGSHPFFFYIVFQDSVGIWHADRKNRDLDTVAQTISLTSTHFSTWSLIDNVKLSVPQTDFRQNETNFIQVVEVFGESQSQGNDELASLPPISAVPDNIVSNWKINGKSNSLDADGKINGSGAKVDYIAPAQIKATRIVQVSVQVKYHLIVYNKGKKVAEFNNFILFLDLTLLTNEHNYGLKLEIGEGVLDVTSYAWSYTYTDQATMDIHISGNDATVSNIVNYPQVFNELPGYCSVTYTPEDSAGALNVDSAVANALNTDTAQIFNLQIYSSGNPPKFNVKCPNQPVNPYTAGPSPNVYGTPDFKLDDTKQIFNDPYNSGPHYIRYTLTPK